MDPVQKPARVVHPEGWPASKGYAHGVAGRGEVLFVAGQVAWDETGRVVSGDFVEQFDRALGNVLTVVHAAGGRGTDIARMTVYVTDMAEYRARASALRPRWNARMGLYYPAMALVQVVALVDPDAKVEIEATALLSG